MAGHERGLPLELVLGNGQLQVGQPGQQGVDAGVRDGPADVLSGALVRAAAEGQVGAVAVNGLGRVGPDLGVDVARPQAEQQHVPGFDPPSRQLRVTGGPAPEDRHERRLVPQDLLQGVRERHVAAGQVRAEAAVGEHHAQGVRDQVGGRLEGRDQHQPQVLHGLVVTESRGVLHQPGGEVPAGHLPLAFHELAEGDRDVLEAGDGRLGALDHVAGRLDEPGSVGLRRPDELGHHQHRQRLGEVLDQVGLSGLGEGVDQQVGEALDVPPDAAPVETLQRLGDRPAQPLVLDAFDQVAHRLPRGHRRQGVVGGNVSLLLVPPVARVPGEPGRGARHVQVLAVAEHQPGREVTLDEDGSHRAVLGAQLLVQAHGVGLGLGAVEPVGRAAGRRGGRTRLGGGDGAHSASGVAARECR